MEKKLEQYIEWAASLNCAITVCDKEANIIYMNQKSMDTFSKGESMVGSNLKYCHNPRSWKTILELLEKGGTNVYSVTKKGVKKLIYQTVWYKNNTVAGLVELSLVLPDQIPHYDRDKQTEINNK